MPLAAAAGRMTEAMKARAAELLVEVGLRERMHHKAIALSGGQP